MIRRRDPCNVIIFSLLALLVATLVLAFIVLPPSRPCPAGSLEQLFTRCEVRP